MKSYLIPFLLFISLLSSFCNVFPQNLSSTISGFVRDEKNGESLPYVNVYIKNENFGTVTNSNGYYVISGIPEGKYQLAFSFIGYEEFVKEIDISSGQKLVVNVSLIPKAIESEGITVLGEKEAQVKETNIGRVSLKRREVNSLPSLAEPDLFRALQMLPGVLSLSDFSSGLYIWGGSPDQNLILLDGIEVYNPTHLGGVFSTFNIDAIKEVELIKGGYPAEYGGRLSAVLNITNKDGNRKEFEGKADVSLLSSKMTLEGPIKNGSWLLSGRRTYIDLATKALKKSGATDFDFPYHFYDFHFKINQDLPRGDKVSISTYLGEDILDFKEDDDRLLLSWGNKTVSSQWSHVFSDKLISNFILAGSRFDAKLDAKFSEEGAEIGNNIVDITAKGNFSYYPNNQHTVKTGIAIKKLDFRNYFKFKAGSESADISDIRNKSYYTALYLQDKWEINQFWISQNGIRINYFSDGKYLDIEPRLSLKYRYSDKLAFKSSIGLYHQYLNLVSSNQESGMLLPFDSWFPVDSSLKPGLAYHYVLGSELQLPGDIETEIDAYYKTMEGLLEFKPSTGEEIDVLADNFYVGKGRAYGMDLLFKRSFGRISGWIGYSLSWTIRQIPEVNKGDAYYPKYDRRHNFNFVNNYELGRNWQMNLRWVYATGQPITKALGQYVIDFPDEEPLYVIQPGKKNNFRMEDYHRLDVSIAKKYQFKRFSISPYLQIINLYNRKNIFTQNYDFSTNPPKVNKISMFPIIPTFGFSSEF